MGHADRVGRSGRPRVEPSQGPGAVRTLSHPSSGAADQEGSRPQALRPLPSTIHLRGLLEAARYVRKYMNFRDRTKLESHL